MPVTALSLVPVATPEIVQLWYRCPNEFRCTPMVAINAPGSQNQGHKVSGRKTRIKICGFTRVEDAVAACDFGVDALGLVFYPPSSRHITLELAAEIVQALPAFVTVTGLFLNEDKSVVDQVLDKIPLSLLQFHGTESAEYCQSFNRPYIKSIAMKSVTDVNTYASQFESARGFLLDSNIAGGAGGSGKQFDWDRVPTEFQAPLVLAGGLDCGNVSDAVVHVRPDAVDVSSGVESAKGVKDHALMKEFIQCVHAADNAIAASKIRQGDK